MRKEFESVKRRLETWRERKLDVWGLPTGLRPLDNLMGGLPEGMIVIAGPTSMGKSALASQIAWDAARLGDYVDGARIPMAYPDVVVIFSNEMPTDQIILRELVRQTGIAQKSMTKGTTSDNEWANMEDGLIGLDSLPVIIKDKSGLSAESALGYLRKLRDNEAGFHRELNPRLVVFDYIQAAGDRAASEYQRLSATSGQLMTIRREFECPVIAVSQLKRPPEDREDNYPRLTDLKGSGSIENDADVVIFIYREAYYDRSVPKDVEHDAQIIVAKDRINGCLGTADVLFVPTAVSFMEEGRYSAEADTP